MSNDKKHWGIRTIGEDEVVGIVKVSWPYPSIKHGILRVIGEQIGHVDWWLDSITEVEFETYQAFGIKEYRI